MLTLTYTQQDSTECLIIMPAHLIVVSNHCCPKFVVDFKILFLSSKPLKRQAQKKPATGALPPLLPPL